MDWRWSVEKGFAPNPVGATWLRFTVQSEQIRPGKDKQNAYRVRVDADRAR